jgi:hypothetical protein
MSRRMSASENISRSHRVFSLQNFYIFKIYTTTKNGIPNWNIVITSAFVFICGLSNDVVNGPEHTASNYGMTDE